MTRSTTRWALFASFSSLPLACGGGGPEAPAPIVADEPVDLAFDTGFVKKAAVRPDGHLLVLLEKPLSLREDAGKPKRELRWLQRTGRIEQMIGSSSERELLDFALHPSGEVTALYASNAGYTLARYNARAFLRSEKTIEDTGIAGDPPAAPPGTPAGPIETITHDTGRVAALAEDVVVAARTARHSVIAYRYRFVEDGLSRRFRTVVVPPLTIYPIGLTGGTYDTFGQVEAQYAVQLAVDDAGTAYVGIQPPRSEPWSLAERHEQVFEEKLIGDPDAQDAYVTRISPTGIRLGTSVVGTAEPDEIYGLRAAENGAFVSGRKEYWNEAGTGFDALIAWVDGASGNVEIVELDVERSDIAFDVASLSGGDRLVVGAQGYSQNPHGASVSEESLNFALLSEGSTVKTALAVPNGARHNEARVLAVDANGRWLLGGMTDGPGTHSADGDAALLRASGFLKQLDLPR